MTNIFEGLLRRLLRGGTASRDPIPPRPTTTTNSLQARNLASTYAVCIQVSNLLYSPRIDLDAELEQNILDNVWYIWIGLAGYAMR